MKRIIFLTISIMLIAYSAWATETRVIGGASGAAEGTDVGFGNMTATSISLGDGATYPDQAIKIGGDPGFYKSAERTLTYSTANGDRYEFNNAGVRGLVNSTPYTFFNTVASSTAPVYAFTGDADTGIGKAGDDQLSLISGEVEALRNYTTYSEFYPSGSGQVRIYDDGTLENTGGIVYSGITTVMGDYSSVLRDYTVFGNATTASITVYLQDASLFEGQIKRVLKDDSTGNTVTLQPYSTQTISHATTYILRDHNSEILIMSRGGNWDRMQATPVSFYADMHLHNNSTPTTINTQNIPHFVQGLFSDDISNGFTFSAGSSGALTVFADYSATVPGAILATDASHGLSTGDTISITNTTNYNGVFNVTVTGSDNFYFTDTFVADDGTGTWYQGDRYSVDPGVGAKYRVGWHCFGSPDSGGGADFEFELFINEAPVEKAESVRTFGNSTDIGTLGGGGIINLVDGDELSFAMINMTDTVDFTATHCNIGLDNI
jgi:hypothetical protein